MCSSLSAGHSQSLFHNLFVLQKQWFYPILEKRAGTGETPKWRRLGLEGLKQKCLKNEIKKIVYRHETPCGPLRSLGIPNPCSIICLCSVQDAGHQQEEQRFRPIPEKRAGQAEVDRHRGQAAAWPHQQPPLLRGWGSPSRSQDFGNLVGREDLYFFIRLERLRGISPRRQNAPGGNNPGKRGGGRSLLDKLLFSGVWEVMGILGAWEKFTPGLGLFFVFVFFLFFFFCQSQIEGIILPSFC